MIDHTTNPFDNGIVPDAWAQPVVDVPGIHGAASQLCLRLLDEVRSLRRRRSLVIHGAAGSGKTHVLARLRREAVTDAAENQPLLCYVRLATSANTIRRHLRSCLVRDLVRNNAAGRPHLETLLIEALVTAPGSRPDRGDPTAVQLRADPTQCRRVREAFDEVCARLGLDYYVARACRLFLLKRRRRAVIQWLSGGSLPEEVGEQLGLDPATDDEHANEPEHAAYRTVRQLISLVTATRPLVLCFDQVEAMQMSADDVSAFFAFGKLAAELFDHGNGMLMITCVQTAVLPQLVQAIAQPDWHRIAQNETRLSSLTEAEARDLIRARLDASPVLRAEPCRQRDPLWPIGEERFQRFLAEEERTPRRLCRLGREAFLRSSSPPLETNAYLSEAFERLRVLPSPAGGSTRPAIVHALALAFAARSPFAVSAPAVRPDVDLVLERPGRQVLISVCNEDGPSLTQRLRRIAEHHPAEREERIVVRDARRPIPRTARKAWEHWHRLQDNAGRTLQGLSRVRTLAPTDDTIASLEAIRSLVSDARAGDLEAHGETVTPAAVEAWLHENLRDESIERLVVEVDHGRPPTDTAAAPIHAPTRDAALETLQDRHVMRIVALAAAISCDVDELRGIVAADTTTFGTLGSPPALVFERISQTS